MPLNLSWRKIDFIFKNRAEIKLTNGNLIIGYGDCFVRLPVSDDSEEEKEYLRFILDNENEEYLTDPDIAEYKII